MRSTEVCVGISYSLGGDWNGLGDIVFRRIEHYSTRRIKHYSTKAVVLALCGRIVSHNLSLIVSICPVLSQCDFQPF